jgi:TrmH family RNA methyltransferase
MYFNSIDIILVKTLYPGNIGSVARAMKTMGFNSLKLVSPQCNIESQAYRMATHAKDMLSTIITYKTLREALTKNSFVIGTTARIREDRELITPAVLADKLVSLYPNNRTALVFGPEDMGLSNEDLQLCNCAVKIPTAGEASSINISHAVMILCYVISTSLTEAAGQHNATHFAPCEQSEQMFDQLRRLFSDSGFFKSEKHEKIFGKFRTILTRAGMTEPDVKLIRGILRQLRWYISNLRKTSN